jgi:tellurite resistance protein
VEFKSQSLFSKPAADAEKPGRKWFKDFFADTPLVSEEEAFLTVLIGAARADDVVSPEEAQELSALAMRTRTLSKLTMARIAELQKHIDEKINREGLEQVLGAACASILGNSEHPEIKKRRAESVFAHAVDLVFADRTVTLSEQAYLRQLARSLKMDFERAQTIAMVIEVKNSY